jgi:hypothetical protein
VARLDQGFFRQFGQLADKRVVELVRMPAIVAITGAGVEQGVAAEQGRDSEIKLADPK